LFLPSGTYEQRSGAVGLGVQIDVIALIACTAYTLCMQYTIRNVPEHLDAALRAAAREQGKSLNDVAVQALARGAGVEDTPRRRRDLSDVASSWHEDAAFDSALAAQDVVDEELWQARKRSRSAPARQRRRGTAA
jgi:plasmid stability protein